MYLIAMSKFSLLVGDSLHQHRDIMSKQVLIIATRSANPPPTAEPMMIVGVKGVCVVAGVVEIK